MTHVYPFLAHRSPIAVRALDERLARFRGFAGRARTHIDGPACGLTRIRSRSSSNVSSPYAGS